MPLPFGGSSKTWNIEHGGLPAFSTNRNTSGWKKFRLLLWKNWTIQKRHKWQIFLEIFLPVFCSIILIVVRHYVPADFISIPTDFGEFFVDTAPVDTVQERCDEIYYAPKNPATERLMLEVRNKYFRFGGSSQKIYTVTGFDTEDELVESYTRIEKHLQDKLEAEKGNDSSSSIVDKLGLFGDSGTDVPILAAVIFTSEFKDDGETFSNNIEYSLRFPAKQRSDFDLITERFGLKAAWYTELVYPYFQLPGPRARFSSTGGMPGYYNEGFLYLQQAIDTTLIKLTLNDTEEMEEYNNYDISLRRFPYPPYIEDKFVFAMQGFLPILIMLSLIYPILNTTRSIVLEKEKKLKESMKMMGLPNYLHWAAWIIKAFTFLGVALILMTCFISIRFTDQAVMEFTNPFLLFLLVFAFALQACSISFFVSTLTNTANIAAIASAVVWFIFFVPYAFLQPRYFFLSRQSKVLGSVFTNAPIALACFILCIMESRGKGLQWADLFVGIGPGDDFCVADCLLIILLNSVFYFSLAFYIECVWPGEYGVPLPWYFPFTKWYWTGKRKTKAVPISKNSSAPRHLLEHEPKGYAGVKINGLTKRFGKKSAVKDLHLNMYESQITALLGHNGAGKTTTMSMLTGLYPPTSGSALINDFDIGSEIDSVRSSLGICPQHDVLFDDLTVAEHVRFFCLLKGYPEELVQDETSRLLKVLGLEDKANAQAHTLSGGMKRKLSVSIAFCGGSRVVLLDEPTSGMDPSARRSCWDLIQSEKKGRTVLLSTHFMEEADLLGDRIAIMADGELQCAGSSLFLKKKYGGGYHLTIVKDENSDVERITALLKQRIPDVAVESNVGAELTYALPDEKSHLFPDMFEELENRKTELGIASYGASITTMEEVFIRVGREAERKIADAFERINRANASSSGISTPSNPNSSVTKPKEVGISMSSLIDSNSKTNLHEQTRRNTGVNLIAQQFRAMIVKKWIYILRNRLLLLGQMIVPVLYITVVLAVASHLPALGNAPPQQISLETFEKYGGVVSSVHCETPSSVCEAFKDTTISDGYTLKEAKNQSLFDFIVEHQIADLSFVNYRYIVGYEETTYKDSSTVGIVGFFNNEPLHTPPLVYNLISNAILKSFDKNTSIKVTNYPMPYTKLESGLLSGQVYTLGFQVGYNLCFGVSFLAAGFVVFLITERESRSKHLQKIAGVKLVIFWLSNYIVDFICFLIPCVAILGVVHLFQVDEYTTGQMPVNMFVLFAVFGAAIIPFMYLWSFAFHEPSNGFIRVAILNVFTGMIPMIVHAVLSIAEFNLGTISDTVNDVFMMFPTYSFGNGMVQMAKNVIMKDQCAIIFDSPESLEFACVLTINPCCSNIKENFFDWEVNGIGKNLASLAIYGVLSFLILIACELRLWDYLKKTSSQTHTGSKNSMDELITEDQDVAEERERIRKTPLRKLQETDNIILRDLTKYYDKFLAVDKLNLGIQRGQTFGLLGVNGAGKTTTFKMLTGDYECSSGDGFVFSHSIRKDIKGVHRNLGYCPQFDGLIHELTGRETLRMMARLRGIWEEDIDPMINRIASDLIFTQHLDKMVKNYSGGNKRKLSTAMALVGNPAIVCLDEPSTGMDPVARRHLWNAITKVRESGTSIVLTSHSLEECEVLCTRLAIMVNGVFRCLGSPQHLKNKFAEGYTIIAQCPPVGVGSDYSQEHQVSGLRRSSSRNLRKAQPAQKWEQALDGLRLFIEESFPGAILKDIHPGFVHYHIRPEEGITWGKLFGRMEIAKVKFNLDAYSVGQTSLEQVFLNFAKSQVEMEEYVRKPGLFDLLMNGIP